MPPLKGDRPSGLPTGRLDILHRVLARHRGSQAGGSYRIPSLWKNPFSPPTTIDVNPYEHYAHLIESLLIQDPSAVADLMGDSGRAGGEWSRSAVVYNMMIRATTAFDHDGDGSLGLPANGQGWRETGSFLKAIGMIPYIRSLGVNTIHLLPVQEIGLDGRRGTMGSVYAIRDLLGFDETLSEPNLGVSAGDQFAAFIEAAHLSGLRIVLELPLRTASKDCVWIKDHPDWFYWIPRGAEFSPPHFPGETLRLINDKVKKHDLSGLPAPPALYRELFTDPPLPGKVRLEGDRFVGTLPDGREVVVPGAFADWPPNDPQPVWDDITYLKYYQDKRYNYISYNTVRMYESTLLEGTSLTDSLWGELAGVIATLVSEYGVDGIMIDMAHALPAALTRRIVDSSRKNNPNVCFWAEDFDRSVEQAEEGFNAVLGGQWFIQHEPVKFKEMLEWISGTLQFPPHLASPETHNTRRAADRPGGTRYSVYAWAISNFIPAIPYMHSGLELAVTHPANTGVGFTSKELKRFHADTLPLFSATQFDWDADPRTLELVRNVVTVRNRFRKSSAPLPGTMFTLLDAGDHAILAFRRASPDGKESFLVIGNSDMEQNHRYRLPVNGGRRSLRDELGGGEIAVRGGLIEGDLLPGQVLFLPEEGEPG